MFTEYDYKMYVQKLWMLYTKTGVVVFMYGQTKITWWSISSVIPFSFSDANNWIYIEMSARLLIDFGDCILAVNNQ